MKKLILSLALMFTVLTANAQNYAQLSCPNNNHPHAIDLGLPSGTKWACCNVGSQKPEEKGIYFYWGGTEEYFVLMAYEYAEKNFGNDIAKTQYDVAHVKWGRQWQMPTSTQFKELLANCKIGNNSNGDIFLIGKNENKILLPIEKSDNYDIFGDLEYINTTYKWNYWTSTKAQDNEGRAYSFKGEYSNETTIDRGKIESSLRLEKGFVRAVYYQTSQKTQRTPTASTPSTNRTIQDTTKPSTTNSQPYTNSVDLNKANAATLKAEAENGNQEAMYILGCRYHDGKLAGIEKNDRHSYNWLIISYIYSDFDDGNKVKDYINNNFKNINTVIGSNEYLTKEKDLTAWDLILHPLAFFPTNTFSFSALNNIFLFFPSSSFF